MQGETSGLKDIVCISRDALLLLWIEASAKCMCLHEIKSRYVKVSSSICKFDESSVIFGFSFDALKLMCIRF